MSMHIEAKQGEIAERILLPGDPLRAKWIAETFFENPVCFNNVRGILGYTGTYKGERISVMATGMGIPSIAIYVTELMRDYGVKTLMRIGTAGSLQEKVKEGDIILAMGTSTTNALNKRLFPGTYCPVADFDLLKAAYNTAKELDINVHVGNVLSDDFFYTPIDFEEFYSKWAEYGVLGMEMEGAALYTLAKKYDCRALMAVSIPEMTQSPGASALEKMIKLGLETIIKF